MISIYGIKNCNTFQKALKCLDAKKVPYQFHNFKEEGVSKETLTIWLKHFPADKLNHLEENMKAPTIVLSENEMNELGGIIGYLATLFPVIFLL